MGAYVHAIDRSPVVPACLSSGIRALGLLDPDGQDVLDPVHVDADGDVGGLVARVPSKSGGDWLTWGFEERHAARSG
ncbi:hypothetical protein GCM10023353_24310 [Tomitella cavernea]|uniref:Uncharacterized protein n=1 Tax=Tomitella cavernea TaxID=1387982 RepID=A0ABP9CSG3_9ACTN